MGLSNRFRVQRQFSLARAIPWCPYLGFATDILALSPIACYLVPLLSPAPPGSYHQARKILVEVGLWAALPWQLLLRTQNHPNHFWSASSACLFRPVRPLPTSRASRTSSRRCLLGWWEPLRLRKRCWPRSAWSVSFAPQ